MNKEEEGLKLHKFLIYLVNIHDGKPKSIVTHRGYVCGSVCDLPFERSSEFAWAQLLPLLPLSCC